MAHVNPHTREVSANIVYYGPTGAGKTASLEYIHRKLRADLRGRLTRVPAQLDPTASYELIPVELGEIKGTRTRFQIASVPGDPIHATTRKALLRDVDGIVFVADSRADRLSGNLESLKDLEENLAAYGRLLANVPLVFQWNRSDQPGALTGDALCRRLNPTGAEAFPSVATDGEGVLQALTTITKLILRNLRSGDQAPAAAPEAPPRRAAGPAAATFRVAEPPPAENISPGPRGEQFDPRSISREPDPGLGALRESLAAPPRFQAPSPPRIEIEEAPEESFAEDLTDSGTEPLIEEDLPEASLSDLSTELLAESPAPPGAMTELEGIPDLEGISDLESIPDLETLTDLDAEGGLEAMPAGETPAVLEAEDLGALDLPMEPFEDHAEGTVSVDALEASFETFDFAGEVSRLAGSDPAVEIDRPERPPAAPEARGDDWEIVGVGAPTRLGPATFSIPLEISEGGGEARVAEITITLSPPKPARKDP